MVLKIAIESQIKTGTVEVLPALIVDTETAEHDFLLDSMWIWTKVTKNMFKIIYESRVNALEVLNYTLGACMSSLSGNI